MKLCFGWLPAPVWQAGVAAVVGSAPCSAPSAAPLGHPTGGTQPPHPRGHSTGNLTVQAVAATV